MSFSNRILELMSVYKVSNILFIASELKLFDYLDKENSVQEISQKLSLNPESLEIILNVFVSYGLVKKEGKRYFLSNEARKFLKSDSTQSLIPLLNFESYAQENYIRKSDFRKSIYFSNVKDRFHGNLKKEIVNTYSKAMHQGGKYASLHIARLMLKLTCGNILEIGGGRGTCAIQLCKLNKEVTVEIYDLPEMEKVSLEFVKLNGLEKRIHFFCKNILKDKIDGVFNGVIISNLLHFFNKDQIKVILKKTIGLLKPKGYLLIHDFFLNEDKTSPLIASLFTLDWMTLGSCFNMSIEDMKNMLASLNLEIVKIKRFDLVLSSFLIAQKKS